MLTRELDFDLPPELIAQTPIEPRDAARLLRLQRDRGGGGLITHHFVHNLPELLRAGDLLVLNDTRVLRARLHGAKPSGGRVEALLLKEHSARGADIWEALLKPSARLRVDGELWFRGEDSNGETVEVRARLLERRDESWLLQFFPPPGRDFRGLLEILGEVPLPPYIHAPSDDARYQTVFARTDIKDEPTLDSAAAPTAGLHFTPELLAQLEARGIPHVTITLGVGVGTFRPVKVENLHDHAMHAEEFWISPSVAARINAHKAKGGRIVAVGTTTVRTLEGAARDGKIRAGAGETRLFLRPGARFQIVDALLTNFHLPRSTLLALVAAFIENGFGSGALPESVEYANGENSSTVASGGDGLVMTQRVYQEAIARRYRFFSFGDAMLIE